MNTKEMTKENKMGVMPVNQLLISMSLPMMISMLVQALYNVVDSIFVSRINENALTAVSLAFPIQSLMIAMGTGTGVGINALLSRSLGEKDYHKADKVASNAVFLAAASYIVFLLTGLFVVGPFYSGQTQDAQILEYGKEYLTVVCCFSFGMYGQFVFERLLQSTGKTFYTMITQGTGAIINIILDPILIFGYLGFPAMGVTGAAAATVLSQAAMTAFIIHYALGKYPDLRFLPRREALKGSVLAEGSRFGLPPAIQSGATSFGNMLLQRFMNGFGDQTVAAITTAYRVDTVLLLPIINFGSGVATMVAQNIGAGRPDRAKRALKIGAAMIAGVSLLLTIFIVLAGEALIAMFGLTSESVEIGKQFFIRIGSFYVIYGLAMAVRGYLEGLGDMVFSGLAGVAALVVRLLASYALADMLNWTVIAYAEALSWLSLLIIYLIRCHWKIRSMNRKEELT